MAFRFIGAAQGAAPITVTPRMATRTPAVDTQTIRVPTSSSLGATVRAPTITITVPVRRQTAYCGSSAAGL